MFSQPVRSIITLLGASLLLVACGNNSIEDSNNGSFSLQITDAPVDGVEDVTVSFTGFTVKPKSGEQLDFTFDDPKAINLLDFSEGASADLISGQSLPAGEYNWVRLDVNADCDSDMASYVETDAGREELRVPSAQGLQLGNGFVITANQNTSFTVDWDLRKGLTLPQNNSDCYKLRPTVRIVDNTEHGSIAGMVDPLLINDSSCTSDVNTQAGNVVYVYEGADIVPDDIDDIDEASPEPITTANVLFNAESGNYEYTAAFLSPLEDGYTVAFTCQGQDDNIPDDEMPDLETNDEIAFTAGQNATVVNGETATVNFE